MKSEFEQREEEARNELKDYARRFRTVDKQIQDLDECLSFSFKQGFYPDTVLQYLSWLDGVEKLGFEEINKVIKADRYRERFTTPRISESTAHPDPSMIMPAVKDMIKRQRNTLIAERASLSDKFLPEAEEKAHRRRVDRLTLQYGKDSVELTTINIAVAVGVPVIILFVTLLGTIAFETFKPEITDWIRHLLGLASLIK